MLVNEFNCIYSNLFCYPFGMDEVRGILENTVSQVLSKSHLTSFQCFDYCIVNNDLETNLLQTELILRDSVESYPDSKEKQDLTRIAEHYRALATRQAKRFQVLNTQYDSMFSAYQTGGMFPAYWGQNLETVTIRRLEFAKDNQYFLQFKLQFVSLNRAMYDRHGRTCLLKFKIMPCQ